MIRQLFLCGDLMLGRGVDQIQAHPSSPEIFEDCAHSALDYVSLTEAATGPLPRRVGADYVWGDLLGELALRQPQPRIANLETAVTLRGTPWPGKGIQYRMHPANVAILRAAGIDCCTLANNHTLDWGYDGLRDTLDTLGDAGIAVAGAGCDSRAAAAPAILPLGADERVLVFGVAMKSAGVDPAWAARATQPGLAVIPEPTCAAADALARRILAERRAGDIVVLSIHWGGNWGAVPADSERAFAHRLVAAEAVDIVHGHSSHHPKALELIHGKAVLYGCGDLINDYAGIGGYESFRPDIGAAYFVSVDTATRGVTGLELLPLARRGFRLHHADTESRRWLAASIRRASAFQDPPAAVRIVETRAGSLRAEAG